MIRFVIATASDCNGGQAGPGCWGRVWHAGPASSLTACLWQQSAAGILAGMRLKERCVSGNQMLGGHKVLKICKM